MDGSDQGANHWQEFPCAIARCEGSAQERDSAAIGFDDLRVQDDRAQRPVFGQNSLCGGQIVFPAVQALLQGGHVDLATGHSVDQSADLALQLRDALLGCLDAARHPLLFLGRAFVIALHDGGQDVGRQQLFLQAGQNTLFQAFGADPAAVGAGAARMAARAAPARLADHGIGATADPASHQA